MDEPSRLTDEFVEELEACIARRIANTGETRVQACDHIRNYILNLIND